MEISRTAMMLPRGSHDSNTSGSNGFSVSPSSFLSDEHQISHRKSATSFSTINSESDDTDQTANYSNLAAHGDATPKETHVVHLSSVEHCMPRAYIRVCLAYRLPEEADLGKIMKRLNGFARKLVDSKPYLSGWVVPSPEANKQVGLAEIQFTDRDFQNYPEVQVRHLSDEEVPYTYDELCRMGMPPSVLRPDLVSALPEGTDDNFAPIFRMQANVVRGGIIVSVYLHHCISDGVGLGFLITGRVLKDDFTFDQTVSGPGQPSLNLRLEAFAEKKSKVRRKLSEFDPNQSLDRHLSWRSVSKTPKAISKTRAPGMGCIFAFSRPRLDSLRDFLAGRAGNSFVSSMDPLHALLWVHMTAARIPSVQDPSVTTSKLLIPVNLRGGKKFKDPLSKSYFGAAVDFAVAQLPLTQLSANDQRYPKPLSDAALVIRKAIERVNEDYTRQLIALARIQDPDIDVRDLMASNMDRANGADMYITSWTKLGLYDSTLELGLDRPDWVRKPWSKDPGSCVVMPDDKRKDYIEVLVQMTVPDMERLLGDATFMSYVVRTVDRNPP